MDVPSPSHHITQPSPSILIHSFTKDAKTLIPPARMADQIFPYHLAGFAVAAFATGYTINSLKQYLTRPVSSIEETSVDPNLLPPSQTRKRKRDPDITSLPPTKRRVPDTVNTSLSANDTVVSDDLNGPSPIKSVKITSNSEQDSVEIKISNGSSRPAHHVLTGSHYGVKISFRQQKHHTKPNDSHAASSRRHKKSRLSSGTSTSENEANEEDYHSDRTMIGDDFDDHDNGSDDQNGGKDRSSDGDEEDDHFEDRIEEAPGADNDLADQAERDHGLQYYDEEDDEQGNGGTNGGAYEEYIQVDIYRQNKVDLMISLPKGGSNDLEIMVQNQQPRIRAMRRR